MASSRNPPKPNKRPSHNNLLKRVFVSPEKIRSFWDSYYDGQKKGGRFVKLTWLRRGFALTPHVPVTVRRFWSRADAIKYMHNSWHIVNQLNAKNPTHFVAAGPQFFGLHGADVLERVYLSPDAYHYRRNGLRFSRTFEKRLRKKGVDLIRPKNKERFLGDLAVACNELWDLRVGGDTSDVNTLVLDYDPPSRKFLFLIIDHGMPHSFNE